MVNDELENNQMADDPKVNDPKVDDQMANDKTYQPKWEERKERDKHHNFYGSYYYGKGRARNHTNGLGGALKFRDVQAYRGLMFILIVGVLFGVFVFARFVVHEVRQIPNADPTTEMKVDELGVRMGDEHAAKLHSDSVIKELELDSVVRTVSVEKHNVYRPPKQDWKDPMLTSREWKNIKKIFSIYTDENGLDWQLIIATLLLFGAVMGIVGFIAKRILRRNGRR